MNLKDAEISELQAIPVAEFADHIVKKALDRALNSGPTLIGLHCDTIDDLFLGYRSHSLRPLSSHT